MGFESWPAECTHQPRLGHAGSQCKAQRRKVALEVRKLGELRLQRLDHGSQLFDRTRLVVTQARQCSAFPQTLAVRGFRCCRVRRIGEWRGELTLSPPERRAQEGAQDEQHYERKQKGEYDGPRQLAGE